MFKFKWAIFSILMLCFVGMGTVSAANWTVNPGNSIQGVIDNASVNDTVIVNDNNGSAYTYKENLVINKKLQLKAKTSGLITIQALNSSKPAFTVNSGGSGSTIQGLTIIGATNSYNIYLNRANNCTIIGNSIKNGNNGIYLYNSKSDVISGNTISNNNRYGIYIYYYSNSTISGNIITNNNGTGIYHNYYSNSTISGNTISNNNGTGIYHNYYSNGVISGNIITSNNREGVFLNYYSTSVVSGNTISGNNREGIYVYYYSSSTISGNTISNNNRTGIFLNDASANINFNRIFGNSKYGLYNFGSGTANATNNWWGTNSPSVYIAGGTVNYNPWLILNVTANPATVSNGNSTITTDLTHNNNGEDTSSQGHIPDNIPVNFTTDLGIVTSTAYTRNGKTNATFNRGISSSGTANITATVDNQTMQTNVTIDTIAPTVTVNPVGGTYNAMQVVTLTVTDNLDPNPTIYYTTNGATPTTASTRYNDLIIIDSTTTLKFMAVDKEGNQAAVQTQNYILSMVINVNTGKEYSSIQAVIDDPLTLNGHVIEVNSGTYSENVVVNKRLTFRPGSGASVVVQALSSLKPVFTINSFGNGTKVQGFVIRGATNSSGIYLNGVSNCNITGNNLTGNLYGVTLYNSSNNTVQNNNAPGNDYGIFVSTNSNSNLIQNNTANNNRDDGIFVFNGSNKNIIRNNRLTGNQYAGILINYNANTSTIKNSIIQNNTLTSNYHGIYLSSGSSNSIVQNNTVTNSTYEGVYIFAGSINNIIQNNNLTNNQYGISLYNNSNNTIYENYIISNQYGIYISNSSANINFNRIFGNSKYGLYNTGNGIVNATNNWWGSNNPIVSSSTGSDIYIAGGTVIYDPWIILNINGSIINVTRNSTSDSEIIVDLTHNNRGEDTSSSGALPDGIPVNFTTTIGTINSSVTTRRGKARATLTSTVNSDATTVSATLDNQTVSRAFRKSFNSIQAAVNDPLTVNGDTIVVGNGTYIENIVVNKNLTVMSVFGGNVTVQASNSLNPVFTVNSGGNGSIIQGFNIIGAVDSYGIYLNSTENCTVWNNTITGNENGVYLHDSSMNDIIGNNVMNSKAQYQIGTGIYLSDSFKNRIIQNNVMDNDYGIWVLNSGDNEISKNTITGNLGDAINVYYQYAGTFPYSDINSNVIIKNNISSNDGNGIEISDNRHFPGSKVCKIYENNISNNLYGIFINPGSVDVYGNNISNNEWDGIWMEDNVGDIPLSYVYLNRIFGNQHGLFCNGALVNATNNWWGTNNPVYTEGTLEQFYNSTADIFLPENSNGVVLYNPWIILTLDPTSYKVSGGKIYESTITAKLIYNSNHEDTSPMGHVPDGIPVNFTTDRGTITNTSYTKKGKAVSTLVLDPNLQSGMTNATAIVDNQSDSIQTDRTANTNIRIISAAIDLSTNQSLDVTYTIPLNESVSWVSVLWKNTGLFHNEVDLIVNGNVVLSRNVVNSAYLTYKNSYSANVFNQTIYLNGIFLSPLESNIYLQNFIKLNPQYQNYTINQLEDVFLARIKQQNNFTDSEINFIKNNRNKFIDSIYVLMTYPGDAAEYLTLTNPNTNETLDFIALGNPIIRASPMIYFDGYTEDGDAGYEGVRSFAIATTKVTNEVVQYWLDKKSLYAPGAMKAAYGTFLTALLVIKCHDMIADQAASQFNVTWSRTTPVVVSTLDDAKNTYITGESDLRMGMDVTGEPGNVWAFRFACSSAFSPIEYGVAGDPTGLSVTLSLGERILNGEITELFTSNGYLVFKIQGKDDLFLLLDPLTGIVTDCAYGINGVYCFHDQITDRQIQLAENLTSSDLSVRPEWYDSIGDVMFSVGSFASMMGTFIFGGETIVTAKLFAPFLLPLMTINLIDFSRDKINAELGLSKSMMIDAMRGVSKIIAPTGIIVGLDEIINAINDSEIVNYTPLAIYNYVLNKINLHVFKGDNSYQKGTYSQSNKYVQEWADDIKGNYTLNNNYQKGEAVFDYVFNNVVTFWHVHDGTVCPIQDVAKYGEANCAETARIVYNLALALDIPEGDVQYVHSESKKHYWVQIRCDGNWIDCDPSHACENTYNVTSFGDYEPASDVHAIPEGEIA